MPTQSSLACSHAHTHRTHAPHCMHCTHARAPFLSCQAFVEAYVQMLQLVRERRPSAPVLSLIYSCDTPYYRALGAKAGHHPGDILEEHVRSAVGAYRAARPADDNVFIARPDAGQAWPEDGGAMEHWGTRGMLKYADAVCACIERDIPGLGWKKLAPARAVSYTGHMPAAAKGAARWAVGAAAAVVGVAVALAVHSRM